MAFAVAHAIAFCVYNPDRIGDKFLYGQTLLIRGARFGFAHQARLTIFDDRLRFSVFSPRQQAQAFNDFWLADK